VDINLVLCPLHTAPHGSDTCNTPEDTRFFFFSLLLLVILLFFLKVCVSSVLSTKSSVSDLESGFLLLCGLVWVCWGEGFEGCMDRITFLKFLRI